VLLQVLNIVRAEAGCAYALPKYHREDELNQCLCYFVLFIFLFLCAKIASRILRSLECDLWI